MSHIALPFPSAYARSATDRLSRTVHAENMKAIAVPGITAADRLKQGLVLKFADGKCAFYPAALLYSVISKAKLQDDSLVVW
jgi:hypothetical protein